MNDNWEADGLLWDDFPTMGLALGELPTSMPEAWYSVPLTGWTPSLQAGDLADGGLSVVLHNSRENHKEGLRVYSSQYGEGEYSPYLEIEYSLGNDPIPEPLTLSGSVLGIACCVRLAGRRLRPVA